MNLIFLVTLGCVVGSFAQNVNQNLGTMGTSFTGTGMGTGMSGASVQGNAISAGFGNLAGTEFTGGFGSPFSTMGSGAMPFGNFGMAEQVFGASMGGLSSMSVPLSPMAGLIMSLARNPNNYRYATCAFNDTWTSVRGRADFRQFLIGEGRQQVNIRVQLSGLPQSVVEVERALHVHEFGDVGDGCARVGPHFNPNQTPHGSKRNFAFLRHVGDIGNIRQSNQGLVSTQFTDNVISLEGINDIVGRSLVLKFERDDEGMGPDSHSKVSGNARTPIACCTIGRTTSRNWYNPLSAIDIQNMAMTGIIPEVTTVNQAMNNGMNTGMNTGMNNVMNTGMNTGMNNVMNTGMNTGMNNVMNNGMNNGMNGFNQNQQNTNFGSSAFLPTGSGQAFNFGTQQTGTAGKK